MRMSEFIFTGPTEDYEASVTLHMDDGRMTLEAMDHDTLEYVELRIPDKAAVDMRDWLNKYIERYAA